jgi:hypothetical protein
MRRIWQPGEDSQFPVSRCLLSAKLGETPTPQVTAHHGVYLGIKSDGEGLDWDCDWLQLKGL